MGNYRSLRVWQAAHELTLAVYHVTGSFPSEERFGLTSQLRRAAASVPANLAEGAGRNSDGELARYARIALGSANELDYHRLLAKDLGMVAENDHERLAEQVRRIKHMLTKLITRL